ATWSRSCAGRRQSGSPLRSTPEERDQPVGRLERARAADAVERSIPWRRASPWDRHVCRFQAGAANPRLAHHGAGSADSRDRDLSLRQPRLDRPGRCGNMHQLSQSFNRTLLIRGWRAETPAHNVAGESVDMHWNEIIPFSLICLTFPPFVIWRPRHLWAARKTRGAGVALLKRRVWVFVV